MSHPVLNIKSDLFQPAISAENPVILAGGGAVMSPHNGVASAKALAEFLRAPVCTTYLHNDAFPANHPLWAGPLGYCGHKTAMKTISEVSLAKVSQLTQA